MYREGNNTAGILIFGGTTEARLLSEELADAGYQVTVSVATEYGVEEMGRYPGVTVIWGRKTAEEIRIMLDGFSVCIDATHPYAVEVSENIRAAIEKQEYSETACRRSKDHPETAHISSERPSGTACTGSEQPPEMACTGSEQPPETACALAREQRQTIRYYRLLRPASAYPEGTVFVSSAKEAARYLSQTEGNVLLTTGAKELPFYASLPGERLYPRVLPLISSLESCEQAGIPARNVIAMQGPFSEELNLALLHSRSIRFLVTKDGGAVGGFPEKINAAQQAGVQVILIGRPGETGYSFAQIRELLIKG